MRRVQPLFEKFSIDYPTLSDKEHVMCKHQMAQLKQLAKVSNHTLALLHPGRRRYHFLHVGASDFLHLRRKEVSADEFQEVVAPSDREHFARAWEMAFRFLEGMPADELKDYTLAFECRLSNAKGVYRRVLLKYTLLEHTGHVALMLYPVAGVSSQLPPRSIYITHLHSRKFMLKEKDCYFCPRELEVASYSRMGYSDKEIADMLFIAKNTVNNHRRRVLIKTGVREIKFAAMYLHDLGVI
jgi:DNA-binding CsgD family transcriptional regulator